MLKFPPIEQFRHTIAKVNRKAQFVGLDEAGEPIFNPLAVRPELIFVGTVKLHGTNAGIVFDERGVTFQSRERELTAEADNCGFYAHMSQQHDALESLRMKIGGSGVIYGEWCGQGTQKGVAISSCPKMFVVFAAKIGDEWVPPSGLLALEEPASSIYSICHYETWRVAINFESLASAQNLLVELTTEVEKQCPVGAAFGIDGIGEGIVWRCVTPGWESSDFWFKVKGEKHSESKVKVLAEIDTEAMFQAEQFVTRAVTEQRLEHGLQNLRDEQMKPFEMSSIGDFLRWVFNDILKEEADVIAMSGLDPKKLGGPIAIKAKRWYIERLNA